jgi:N-acetylmuramoyl-L-alanine amidase
MKKNKITDHEILTKTLYYEVGVCGMFETFLVAWLIRNRVKANKRKFGKGYLGVCLKPFQFSCWNNKSIDHIDNIKFGSNAWWKRCILVADYVLKAPEKENPISKTYHYYNPQLVCPYWGNKLNRVFPNLELKHIFLKK